MQDQWRIASYDPEWVKEFNRLGVALREALGSAAIRIDHVGSTSIVGMEAKPIIDIQISVVNLDDEKTYIQQIEQLSFCLRIDNPDKTKKYFRETHGKRRTHIHVRQAGSYAEQVTLLFRDYLRLSPEDCRRYSEEKHRLFDLYKDDRSRYVEGKGPIVWDILMKAHSWSQMVGWRPGKSDL
ncbi:GrpB family protein [Paenibacillus sambharensis]|uniref:GrpB family protein n=1 Tax=Paenibacillus sambharensis TaxID=1803190 RepID=A0A2W1LD54_9BACL|nr:GrpB family protein [Paenibacillus sambharensis]PZD97016.1 GrpB family protein [Paenibacillus sambharensis]